MRITRRQLLRSAAATAVLSQTHLLSRVRPAAAASANDPILVLVYLDGGNDLLGTVIPLNSDVTSQYSIYRQLRPDLTIPARMLDATEIGRDPVRGTALALNPNCGRLKALFDQGKLALINGVGFPNSSLSHFTARDVWHSGDLGRASTGWVGRQLDAEGASATPRAISFGGSINASLASMSNDTIGTRRLADFHLPSKLAASDGEDAARLAAWATIFGDAHDRSGLVAHIARSGSILISSSQRLGEIQNDRWGPRSVSSNSGVARDLRQVASVLRHDALSPSDAGQISFFHVVAGGFDTHADQGTTEIDFGHGRLMQNLSDALADFQLDLEYLGMADRVITLVYSEFGRRAYQNGTGAGSGTDHGRAGVSMLMGAPVAGGIYGAMPDLRDLDDDGNLKVTTDFRRLYAAIIQHWLGGDPAAVLPGGPFAPLPVLA